MTTNLTGVRSMNIVPHEYNGKLIDQLSEDTVIAGKLIPKGYCNLTQLCKANGKRLDNYFRLKSTQTFIEGTSAVTSLSSERLIIVIQGGDYKDVQGTWGHINIAINLAQWISPKFAAWASQTLRLILQNDFQALTPEAEKAKEELQKTWQKLRDKSKITRRTLTDAIKQYLSENEVSNAYEQHIYSNCSDAINLAVFGKRAKEIREERGVADNDLLRDSHDEKDLILIDRIEDFAMRLIDRGYGPLESVREAIEFYCS